MQQTSPVQYMIHSIDFCPLAGISLSINDLERFATARARLLTGEHLRELSVTELEALRRVPGDLVKITPALIVAILPASVLFLPLFFTFPRKLLTSRFWSEEQRRAFESDDFRKRNANIPKLTKYFLRKIPEDATELKMALSEVTKGQPLDGTVFHSLHPFFRGKPFAFSHLSVIHLELACRCHACRQFRIFRRTRLNTYARILLNQDSAILQEGLDGISRSRKEDLCITRGLLPFDLTDAQLDNFLQTWISYSSELNPDTDLSLYLHLPMFLSHHWQSGSKNPGG